MRLPIRHHTLKNIFSALLLLAFSCAVAQKELYRSQKFTLYDNKVVQGKYTAEVKSPTNIVSDYQSTASQNVPRHIVFKFSINEKDVEMKPGENHEINVGTTHESPIVKFGTTEKNEAAVVGKFLSENYKYTFRVDMNDVLRQFREKGYYTTYDGSRIAKADFKGLYIAGAAEPLSWDFSNLDEKKLKLQDNDGNGIYEITLLLNPVNADAKKANEWKLSRDISSKPTYISSQPIVDALFKLSTEEALINIEPDSTFRTGAKWGGVWTRDISYSIILAFAYHQPDIAKVSLMKKVKRDRIIQDTGSGGAWPVSSDRAIWAVAAWEVYKATGDRVWLEKSFSIIKNSLDDDNKTLRDPLSGMYRGESSFLDWREQTYPKWMSNTDIFVSENLGTNAVHYQAQNVLASMGKLLGKDVTAYENRAEEIKEGINRQLWMKDKGYYAQYLYGRYSLTPSPRFEALGEALAILFGIADEARSKEIMARSPLTDFGATCIYPQIPGIPPYHNNAVWPFVQSYWNLAAAKAQNEDVLNHGLAAIYRAGGLFLTNYENFVADNGDYVGTEINSDRMLWSMAGNLAMVHRVFIGMDFRETGILFHPAVPKNYDGKKTLTNFKYRKAELTISVIGHGNQIASFTIDGKASKNPFFPASLRGSHMIEIRLKNNDFTGALNLVQNHFSLPNPIAKIGDNTLKWDAVSGAVSYNVYKNGQFEAKVTTNLYAVASDRYAEYKVSAIDEQGYESFTSEPVTVYPADAMQLVELEDFVPASTRNYTNYSGKGFVETTKNTNREITFKINAVDDGNYFIDFRYSNGNGPWNTENKCAIRSLYVNTYYNGVIVMPQRGSEEWSDWGYTNSSEVSLKKGENTLSIQFEDWNNNMNVDENTAMIDYCRVIRMQ